MVRTHRVENGEAGLYCNNIASHSRQGPGKEGGKEPHKQQGSKYGRMQEKQGSKEAREELTHHESIVVWIRPADIDGNLDPVRRLEARAVQQRVWGPPAMHAHEEQRIAMKQNANRHETGGTASKERTGKSTFSPSMLLYIVPENQLPRIA